MGRTKVSMKIGLVRYESQTYHYEVLALGDKGLSLWVPMNPLHY